jgi:hypothetical protein
VKKRDWLWPTSGLATFIVDPPTMLVAGAVFAWLGDKFLRPRMKEGPLRDNVVLLLCASFQVFFWVSGSLLYFEVIGKGYGNDFMWNGYLMGYKAVKSIPTYHSGFYNGLALAGWLVQPFFLWLGVQLGYNLVRRPA